MHQAKFVIAAEDADADADIETHQLETLPNPDEARHGVQPMGIRYFLDNCMDSAAFWFEVNVQSKLKPNLAQCMRWLLAFLFIALLGISAQTAEAHLTAQEDGYQIYLLSDLPENLNQNDGRYIYFRHGKYLVQIPRNLNPSTVEHFSVFARNGYRAVDALPDDVQRAFQTKRLKYFNLMFSSLTFFRWPNLPEPLRRTFGQRISELDRLQDALSKIRVFDALLFSQAETIVGQPISGAFFTFGVPLMAVGDFGYLGRIVRIFSGGRLKMNPDVEKNPQRYGRLGLAIRLGVHATYQQTGSIYIQPLIQFESPQTPFVGMPFGCAIGPDACLGISMGGENRVVTRGTSLGVIGLPVRMTSTEDGGLLSAVSILPPVVPTPIPGLPVVGTVDMGFVARFTQFSLPIPLFIRSTANTACEDKFFPPEDIQ